MKKLVLLATLLAAGCIGSPCPRNPLVRNHAIAPVTSDPWWQQNTAGLKPQDNPWEAFNQPRKEVAPVTSLVSFPPDWTSRCKRVDAYGTKKQKPVSKTKIHFTPLY